MTADGIERVTTPRMVLERLVPGHAEELCQLLLDPAVARTLWPFPVAQTRRDVVGGLLAKIEHWDRNGFGLWLARDRNTGAMVGRGGLQYTYTVGSGGVEAAWAIVPARWGQGLATELAQAAVEVACGALGLLDVVALAGPDNRASRRVMEKTGFRYERDIEHAGRPHVLYRRRFAVTSRLAAVDFAPFRPRPLVP